MARLTRFPSIAEAPADSRPILENLPWLSLLPDFYMSVAGSAAALRCVIDVGSALAKSELDTLMLERIGVAITAANGSNYCEAAYRKGAAGLGLDAAEIEANGQGRSNDKKADVALTFARRLTSGHGTITDEDVAGLRKAGYTDREIIEIVAQVGVVTLSSYLCNLFDNPPEP